MNARHILSAAFLAMAMGAAAQYQMTVSPSTPLPPPYTYAELADATANAFVNIENSGAATDVRARVVLRNADAGIVIRSLDAVGTQPCFHIPAGPNMFAVEELAPMFSSGGGFDADLFSFEGISASQIESDQQLPGPSWELCIQLLSCPGDDALSGPVPQGCVTFFVPTLYPPELTDICDREYTLPDGILTISWTYMPPIGFEHEIDYRLEIVKIEPADGREGDANDAMLSATEPNIFTVEYDEAPAQIEIPDELELDAGFRYAVRVTAFSPDGTLPVVNQGHSIVCSFLYSPESTGGTGILRPVWPAGGNAYPFDFVPLILKFEPYREYTHFDWTTTLNSDGAGAYPTRTDDNNWPSGPVAGQSSVTFTVTEDEAQHLATYYNNATMPSGHSFRRGEQYHWRTAGDFTLGSSTYHGDTGEEPFQIGMGASQPLSPADGASVDTGDVQLRWNTADIPDPLLPPYNVVQARSAAGTTFINGWVNERWKLEVSRTSDFATILFDTTGTLGGSGFDLVNAIEDPTTFRNEMYKQLDASVHATDTGTYYWRLHWKVDPTNESSANYNTSPVFRFIIGEGGTTASEDEEGEEPGECVSECEVLAPSTATTRSVLAMGATVKVGQFDMEIETVSGSGTFAGEGHITVDFLNEAKIKVEFTGLRVNDAGEMFAGTVTARKDWTPLSLTTVTSGAQQIPSIDSSDAVSMNGYLIDGHRLVSLLSSSGSPMSLPIGMDREVGGRQVILGIINMVFTPTRAHLDMVAGIEITEVPTMLSFGVGDMCFTPGGLGDEGRAYLASNIDIPFNGNTFSFKGGASTDLANLTYFDWDCNGFKCLQVAAGIKFSRDNIVPAGETEEGTTTQVSADFKVQVCTDWDFLAQFTMDPFEATGAPGWVFTIEEAWIDLSSVNNPPTILFPTGYGHPSATGGASTVNLWEGFFLKRLSMASPAEITGADDAPFTASVNNFIIDDLGLTMNVALTNLVNVGEGNLDGCSFSMDSLYIDIWKSTFRGAGLKGQVGLPIAGEHDYLNYLAVFGQEDDDGDGDTEWGLALEVNVDDGITFPAWVAQVELKPNTLIRARLGATSKLHMELNATLAITDGEGGGDSGNGLSMPGIHIEHLVYDTQTGYECNSCFSVSSPDKSMSGFPLTITDIGLDLSDVQKPGLSITPMLTFGSESVSLAAAAEITFFVNVNTNESGIDRVSFDRVAVNDILIETDLNGITLEGRISWINEATKKEFRGELAVGLPMGIKGKLKSIFGVSRANPSAPFNTAQNYPYWLIDGQVYFTPGLTLFTGVELIGFGGGLWYHMEMVPGQTMPGAEQVQGMAATAPPEEEGAATNPVADSGLDFREHFATDLGLRLGVVLACQGNHSTYNLDVELIAEFSNGSISRMEFNGDLYALADIDQRENAPLTASVSLAYVNNAAGKVFDGSFVLWADFEVIYGGMDANKKMVDARVHFDPEHWYFKMGEPKSIGAPAELKVGIPGLNLSLTTYIMTGNSGIPAQLPPPPQRILNILNGDPAGRLGTEAETDAVLNGDRDEGTTSSLPTGAGFAFGATFEVDVDLSLAIIYAKFYMGLGFDVNLSKLNSALMCAGDEERGYDEITDPGRNRWFAQGQFYCGMEGELGVQLNLIFKKFRFPIINLSAAMLVKGNLPNPMGFKGQATVNYAVLGGRFSGSASFQVEKGQPCLFMIKGDPLADIKFIRELAPVGNDVSVFALPQAALEFPMNQLLELPKRSDPETGEMIMYRFYPYMSSYTLKNLNNGSMIPGTPQIVGGNTALIALERENMLDGQTDHQIHVRVQVKDEIAPGSRIDFINPETGSLWYEEKDANFRTGDMPDHIEIERVDYTYPVHAQRYFLPGESNNKGKVQLTMGMPQLFETEVEGETFTFVARYIPLDGSDPLEMPINYTGGQVLPLDLPALQPETAYECQLLKRRTPTMQEHMADVVGNTNVVLPGITADASTQLTLSNSIGETMTLNGGATVTDLVKMGKYDHELYNFSFRTSKFNTLHQKLAALELDGTWPSTRGNDLADVKGQMEEKFDDFDIDGVWKGGSRKLAPLVRIAPVFSDDYYHYLSVRYSGYLSYSGTRNYTFDVGSFIPPYIHLTVPSWPAPYWLLWTLHYPDEPVFDHYSYPAPPLAASEMSGTLVTVQQPSLSTGLPLFVPGASTATGSSFLGGGASAGLGGLFGGSSPFGSSPFSGINSAPPRNLNLTFLAGRLAWRDFMEARDATREALHTTKMAPLIPKTLEQLLQIYGPQNRYVSMRSVAYFVSPQTTQLLHSDNMPPPDEFGRTYSNNYHVKFWFRSPVSGSQNTSSTKPFTLRHEAPAYSGTGPH